MIRGAVRRLAHRQPSRRRASGHGRPPGHRALAMGSQPRDHRGPGHLSARHLHDGPAARQDSARHLGLWLLLGVHALRRWSGSVLGPARGQEQLAGSAQGLPAGVRTALGPDANGLRWIFQYVLFDPTGHHDAGQLRVHAGLVCALPLPSRSGNGRGRLRRRVRALSTR